MNDRFNDQKEKLVSIKHEINLLNQQVSYLLKNEKAIELLDLDVLMNRTHTLYDLLCSINLGEDVNDEDLEFDPEALSGIFGPMMQQGGDKVEEETEVEEEVEVESEAEDEPDEQPIVAAEPIQEEIQVPESNEIPLAETKDEVVEQEASLHMEELQEEVVDQPIENEQVASYSEEKPLSDEFGFFFRFEDVPEQEKVEIETSAEPEGKVIHFVEEVPEEEIPERDLVDGESLVKDNPLEMPKMEHEVKDDDNGLFGQGPDLWNMKSEEIEHSEPSEYEDVFKRDDTGFEMATIETLGERMMQEDHSVAAKLQQESVRDLRSVIGINDKFLFVNELFGGSMDKFNKSIENLNDLKTLNGAMIYLNELKIELQWNSSNEAYLKLKDLVAQKFE